MRFSRAADLIVLSSLILLGVSACGGSPTAPAPVVTSIQVTVPAVVKVGETVRATAIAGLSGGGTQAVVAGWRSDTPSVATVTDAGNVTGIGNGRVTIYVITGGQQGQSSVRVLPDYQGAWTGTYRITRCTPFPVLAATCNDLAGTVRDVAFTLTQSGEFVSGQFTIDAVTLAGVVSSIDSAGGLLLSSQGRVPGQSGQTIDAQWSLTSPEKGQITGTTSQVRQLGTSGSVAEGPVAAAAR